MSEQSLSVRELLRIQRARDAEIATLTAERDSHKTQREMADLRYTEVRAELAKMKAHRDRYAAKCDRLTAELDALKAKLPVWIKYTKDSRDIGILVSEMQAAAKGGEG